jgi:hypothetical protein
VGLVVGAIAMISGSAFAFDKYGVPTITCVSSSQTAIQLQICGDALTGAPAGVSIHWTTKEDYDANGWGGDICELSLSGMPGRDHGNADSRWDLGPGECQVIQIGDNLFDETGASGNCHDPLVCGTEYVFRIFAHADRNAKRSDFSGPTTCATADCDAGGCSLTQGYWKNHGPVGCASGNNDNEWGLTSLTMGTVNYTDLQMCAIFNQNPPNCGGGQGSDALVKLAHQLMAAELNEANSADVTCISATMTQAHALIGGLIVAPTAGSTCVGSNTPLGAQMNAVANTLDQYNNGLLACASHCTKAMKQGLNLESNPLNGGQAAPAKKTSWGQVKSYYR